MKELPRLFDDKAQFIEPDTSTLSPDAVKALGKVRSAYEAVKDAEQQETAAQAEISAALKQVASAELAVKPYGEYGFHRLWQQSVQRR